MESSTDPTSKQFHCFKTIIPNKKMSNDSQDDSLPVPFPVPALPVSVQMETKDSPPETKDTGSDSSPTQSENSVAENTSMETETVESSAASADPPVSSPSTQESNPVFEAVDPPEWDPQNLGVHVYGDAQETPTELFARLPLIALLALQQYEQGLLPNTTPEQVQEILNSWRSAPWKTAQEIQAKREEYLQFKFNEWLKSSQRSTTPVSSDSQQSDSHLEKRARLTRTI